MRRVMQSMFVVGALALLMAPGVAFAEDGEKEHIPDMTLSLGLKGGMNGSWVTEVPENDPDAGGQDPNYFPLFGLGAGVGGMFELRAMGWLGLETGYYLSFDNGKGWNDVTAAGSDAVLFRLNQEQKTKSRRIPILLKFTSPTGTVRPVVGLGVEFVNQTESTIQYTSEDRNARANPDDVQSLQNRNQIEPSSYVVGMLSVGLDIDLGKVRIPIELRGQYNLGYDESFGARVRKDGQQFIYDGGYQGHFGLFIGFAYDHDLFF